MVDELQLFNDAANPISSTLFIVYCGTILFFNLRSSFHVFCPSMQIKSPGLLQNLVKTPSGYIAKIFGVRSGRPVTSKITSGAVRSGPLVTSKITSGGVRTPPEISFALSECPKRFVRRKKIHYHLLSDG